jgi:Asp-tRNA(Asn)/Glu-tRNA(Gln) amidotransferase A subunit family amidase
MLRQDSSTFWPSPERRSINGSAVRAMIDPVAEARARFDARPDNSSWMIDASWDTTSTSTSASPLHGLPIAVKSNYAVAGLRTLAGSAARDDGTVAEFDCPAVAALRTAGAVIVGTLNMNELAYGFTGVNRCFGDVVNPHDADRVAGGSSSASAAIVGAGVLDAALGTDTNGSIRVPAALCGVWGFRPSSGSVSTEGIVPLAQTLDVPGPLTRNVDLLRAIATALGVDTGATAHVSARVAMLRGFPAHGAQPAVTAAVARVAKVLGAGPTVELDWTAAARAASQVLTGFEAARNHRALLAQRPERLEPLTRARLRAGLAVDDRWAQRAFEVRDRLRSDPDGMFDGADVIVLASVAMTAPRRDTEFVEFDGTQESVNAALGRCTSPFSLVGAPVVSVPFSELDDNGLPIGVQLVGRPGLDALVLALARVLEDDGIAAAQVRPGA